MIIAFTIGNTFSYEESLNNDPENCQKIGANGNYEGGWIWKTVEEANNFINSEDFLKVDWGDGKPRKPQNFSVYKVLLVNGFDDVSPIPGKDGIYHLLINSKFDRL